jgi:hypothetical protein
MARGSGREGVPRRDKRESPNVTGYSAVRICHARPRCAEHLWQKPQSSARTGSGRQKETPDVRGFWFSGAYSLSGSLTIQVIVSVIVRWMILLLADIIWQYGLPKYRSAIGRVS